MMTICDNLSDFYITNLDKMHSFLCWKGLTDQQEREDIISSWITLLADGEYQALQHKAYSGNLYTRSLQCHLFEWLRIEKSHAKFAPQLKDHQDYWLGDQAWADTSASTDTTLGINDFYSWVEKHPYRMDRPEIDQIKADAETVGSGVAYGVSKEVNTIVKRFCRKRDDYRQFLISH